MTRIAGTFVLLLLTSFLSVAAPAQELYVSNKPFNGMVVKSGSGLQVELAPLLKALKMDLKVEGGQIKVGDKSLAVIADPSGKELVSLPEFAAAANLIVRKNPDFGYTDVYANASAPAGSWGEDTASSSSGSTGGAAGKPYTIRVPSGYEMIDDPELMDALMGMARKKSGGGQIPEGALTAEFVIAPDKSETRGGMMMLMTLNFPGSVPEEAEEEFKGVITRVLQEKGKVISGPSPYNIGGLRFQKALAKTDEGSVMESYFHLAGARGKVYWLALVDDEATYSTSFAPLRNAVDSFRLK